MSFRAAALVFALVVSPATLHAQDAVFTVNVPSADVYQGPSNVTPVIGHAPRGTAMPVLRNLGSWVKVPWPSAPDGFAYVHVTMGRLAAPAAAATGPRSSQGSSSSAAAPSSVSAPASSPGNGQTPMAPQPRPAPRERVVVRGQQDSTTISHVVGVGGMVGTMHGVGATARAWRDNRLGIQIGFTREAITSDVTADRTTSLQFEPAVVYGLYDFVSDYFWIRPYVGSGVGIRHQTLHGSAAGAAQTSENGVSFRVFGGSEMTFAGAPRFALSVDVGYRRLPTPFDGFTDDHFAASISGHWYIK